jgi:hypothetical protein
MNAMRAATVMLVGFFVVVGAAIPTPWARMHPPGMDVTKPEKPHYVLLRRKPERDPNIVAWGSSFFGVPSYCQAKLAMSRNRNWECLVPASLSYSPILPGFGGRITFSAEAQRP